MEDAKLYEEKLMDFFDKFKKIATKGEKNHATRFIALCQDILDVPSSSLTVGQVIHDLPQKQSFQRIKYKRRVIIGYAEKCFNQCELTLKITEEV